MSLRFATTFLIAGLVYTVLHKIVFTFFPSIGHAGLGRATTSALWLLSVCAFILFGWQFLKEIRPRKRSIRCSLTAVIVFTAGIVVSRLPVVPSFASSLFHRWLFGLCSLGNAYAFLIFLIALMRFIPRGSVLWWPARASIVTTGLTASLGTVSFGYFVAWVLTGHEIEPLSFLQPLALPLFFCTYGTSIWFLLRFRSMADYQVFAQSDLP